MRHRCGRPEALPPVVEPRSEVEGGAADVYARYGFVGVVVVFVVGRYVDLRAAELLVEHPRLQADRQCASEKFQVITELEAHVEIVIKPLLLLAHDEPGAQPSLPDFERCLGNSNECPWRIVDAHPLHA